MTLGRAVELFLAAKAAEGASPRTIEWYRMILVRLVRSTGHERAVDGLDPAELRAWLVELRTTLAPVGVAGYVRTLRVLGNWLAAEGLADAAALRGLRRPRVPQKVIEPIADDDPPRDSHFHRWVMGARTRRSRRPPGTRNSGSAALPPKAGRHRRPRSRAPRRRARGAGSHRDG